MSLLRLRPADAESRIREDFDREAWPHFREITRAALRLTRRAPAALRERVRGTSAAAGIAGAAVPGGNR